MKQIPRVSLLIGLVVGSAATAQAPSPPPASQPPAEEQDRGILPEGSLAYPVLLKTEKGEYGSGFYLVARSLVFLVTARHVLLEADGAPKSATVSGISYSKVPTASGRVEFTLHMKELKDGRGLADDPGADVAVVRLGRFVESAGKAMYEWPTQAQFTGKPSEGGMFGAPEKFVRKYDDVQVSNTSFVFGFPISVGVAPNVQFDVERPLLRSGIIAGKDPTHHRLILDLPAYGGNSGGLVLQQSFIGVGFRYSLVGVVLQFVPYVEEWENKRLKYSNTFLSNSGYTVAAPMDPVLALIDILEKQTPPAPIVVPAK